MQEGRLSCKEASWKLAVQRLALWAAGGGVLALRQGPLTRAVQEGGQLQEQPSQLEASSAGGQAKCDGYKLVSS